MYEQETFDVNEKVSKNFKNTVGFQEAKIAYLAYVPLVSRYGKFLDILRSENVSEKCFQLFIVLQANLILYSNKFFAEVKFNKRTHKPTFYRCFTKIALLQSFESNHGNKYLSQLTQRE